MSTTRKYPGEGGKSNRKGHLREDIFTTGKFFSISFKSQFNLPLKYNILQYFINILDVTLRTYLSLYFTSLRCFIDKVQ